MKKLLLLIPLLVSLFACNFAVSAGRVPTATPPAILTPTLGTVTGKLSYPSEFLPPMRVVLFSLTDKKAYFVDTAKNWGEFFLNVPAGTYYLVSYPHEGTAGNTGQVDSYTLDGGPTLAGGYTQMVPCGLSANCTDHTLLPITVAQGQTVNADPADWYAPEGTFPPMPNP